MKPALQKLLESLTAEVTQLVLTATAHLPAEDALSIRQIIGGALFNTASAELIVLNPVDHSEIGFIEILEKHLFALCDQSVGKDPAIK